MPHVAQKTPVWIVARTPETPAFRTFPVPAGTDVPTGVGPLDERVPKVGWSVCPNVGWAGEGFRLPIGARDGARTVGAFAGIGGVGGTDSVDTSSSFIGLTGGCTAGDGSELTSGAGVDTEKADARASSAGPVSTG